MTEGNAETVTVGPAAPFGPCGPAGPADPGTPAEPVGPGCPAGPRDPGEPLIVSSFDPFGHLPDAIAETTVFDFVCTHTLVALDDFDAAARTTAAAELPPATTRIPAANGKILVLTIHGG